MHRPEHVAAAFGVWLLSMTALAMAARLFACGG